MSKLLAAYRLLGPLLRPAGLIYGLIMRFRRKIWYKCPAHSYRPACPTIAVGNISWGGTGKTPITAWLLHWAETQNLRAAVLSRGYKGKTSVLPLPVSPATSPQESGDEPLMLARAFPKAKVLVDPRRSRAALYAEKNFSPNLIIADDAFQHLALARDFNIVLLTPADLTSEWNRVIPSGSWREDASALRDAQAVLLRLPAQAEGEELSKLMVLASRRLGELPCFGFRCRPGALRRLGPCVDRETALEIGQSSKIFPDPLGFANGYNLFCGVGFPEGVRKNAIAVFRRPPHKFTPFPDHHHYTREDLHPLLRDGLDLVCTEKDAVKLEAEMPDMLESHRVWALGVEVEFLNGCSEKQALNFPEFWQQEWEKITAAHNSTNSDSGSDGPLRNFEMNSGFAGSDKINEVLR
ncbi:MAG: tetraacyldisaccharide 4'-kinase [Desulfovibrionaceae bacterium]|nr:tetraacyldisaccharide 4'-kinase [Desulfovibrionaceae bacterium]